ncbi:hypothetical protein Tco_0808554 [Tanacetum coccineum]
MDAPFFPSDVTYCCWQWARRGIPTPPGGISPPHWTCLAFLDFGNGSSSGYHGGLWWLIENEEDDVMVVNIWREFIRWERFGNGMDLN